MENIPEDQHDSTTGCADSKQDIPLVTSPKKQIQLGVVQSSTGGRTCMGNLMKKSRWDQAPKPGEEEDESKELKNEPQGNEENSSSVKSLIEKFEGITGNYNTSENVIENEGLSKSSNPQTPSRVKLVRTNFMKSNKSFIQTSNKNEGSSSMYETDDVIKPSVQKTNISDLKSDSCEMSEVKPVAASKALEIISSYYDSPTDESSEEPFIASVSEKDIVAESDGEGGPSEEPSKSQENVTDKVASESVSKEEEKSVETERKNNSDGINKEEFVDKQTSDCHPACEDNTPVDIVCTFAGKLSESQIDNLNKVSTNDVSEEDITFADSKSKMNSDKNNKEQLSDIPSTSQDNTLGNSVFASVKKLNESQIDIFNVVSIDVSTKTNNVSEGEIQFPESHSEIISNKFSEEQCVQEKASDIPLTSEDKLSADKTGTLVEEDSEEHMVTTDDASTFLEPGEELADSANNFDRYNEECSDNQAINVPATSKDNTPADSAYASLENVSEMKKDFEDKGINDSFVGAETQLPEPQNKTNSNVKGQTDDKISKLAFLSLSEKSEGHKKSNETRDCKVITYETDVENTQLTDVSPESDNDSTIISKNENKNEEDALFVTSSGLVAEDSEISGEKFDYKKENDKVTQGKVFLNVTSIESVKKQIGESSEFNVENESQQGCSNSQENIAQRTDVKKSDDLRKSTSETEVNEIESLTEINQTIEPHAEKGLVDTYKAPEECLPDIIQKQNESKNEERKTIASFEAIPEIDCHLTKDSESICETIDKLNIDVDNQDKSHTEIFQVDLGVSEISEKPTEKTSKISPNLDVISSKDESIGNESTKASSFISQSDVQGFSLENVSRDNLNKRTCKETNTGSLESKRTPNLERDKKDFEEIEDKCSSNTNKVPVTEEPCIKKDFYLTGVKYDELSKSNLSSSVLKNENIQSDIPIELQGNEEGKNSGNSMYNDGVDATMEQMFSDNQAASFVSEHTEENIISSQLEEMHGESPTNECTHNNETMDSSQSEDKVTISETNDSLLEMLQAGGSPDDVDVSGNETLQSDLSISPKEVEAITADISDQEILFEPSIEEDNQHDTVEGLISVTMENVENPQVVSKTYSSSESLLLESETIPVESFDNVTIPKTNIPEVDTSDNTLTCKDIVMPAVDEVDAEDQLDGCKEMLLEPSIPLNESETAKEHDPPVNLEEDKTSDSEFGIEPEEVFSSVESAVLENERIINSEFVNFSLTDQSQFSEKETGKINVELVEPSSEVTLEQPNEAKMLVVESLAIRDEGKKEVTICNDQEKEKNTEINTESIRLYPRVDNKESVDCALPKNVLIKLDEPPKNIESKDFDEVKVLKSASSNDEKEVDNAKMKNLENIASEETMLEVVDKPFVSSMEFDESTILQMRPDDSYKNRNSNIGSVIINPETVTDFVKDKSSENADSSVKLIPENVVEEKKAQLDDSADTVLNSSGNILNDAEEENKGFIQIGNKTEAATGSEDKCMEDVVDSPQNLLTGNEKSNSSKNIVCYRENKLASIQIENEIRLEEPVEVSNKIPLLISETPQQDVNTSDWFVEDCNKSVTKNVDEEVEKFKVKELSGDFINKEMPLSEKEDKNKPKKETTTKVLDIFDLQFKKNTCEDTAQLPEMSHDSETETIQAIDSFLEDTDSSSLKADFQIAEVSSGIERCLEVSVSQSNSGKELSLERSDTNLMGTSDSTVSIETEKSQIKESVSSILEKETNRTPHHKNIEEQNQKFKAQELEVVEPSKQTTLDDVTGHDNLKTDKNVVSDEMKSKIVFEAKENNENPISLQSQITEPGITAIQRPEEKTRIEFEPTITNEEPSTQLIQLDSDVVLFSENDKSGRDKSSTTEIEQDIHEKGQRKIATEKLGKSVEKEQTNEVSEISKQKIIEGINKNAVKLTSPSDPNIDCSNVPQESSPMGIVKPQSELGKDFRPLNVEMAEKEGQSLLSSSSDLQQNQQIKNVPSKQGPHEANIESTDKEIKVSANVLLEKSHIPINTLSHEDPNSSREFDKNVKEAPATLKENVLKEEINIEPKHLGKAENTSSETVEKIVGTKEDAIRPLVDLPNENTAEKETNKRLSSALEEAGNVSNSDSSDSSNSKNPRKRLRRMSVKVQPVSEAVKEETMQSKKESGDSDIPETSISPTTTLPPTISEPQIKTSPKPTVVKEVPATTLPPTISEPQIKTSPKPTVVKEVPAPVRVSARQKQRQAAAAAALAAEEKSKSAKSSENVVKKGINQEKVVEKRGKKSLSPTKELNLKISSGKSTEITTIKQLSLTSQKSPRPLEIRPVMQTSPKKIVKELGQDKLEPITLKLSKEDNPVIVRSSSLSPKKVLSPVSPQTKTLGYTLKIGKDSTTIVPKESAHSPKTRDSSPGSSSKADLSGKVGYLIKDTGLTITPIAPVESQEQKLNKITLKLSKAGGHPEIKQDKSETWKAIQKLGEIDIVPVEGKTPTESSKSKEKLDHRSQEKKLKMADVTVEPSTSSSMSKLQGLLTKAPLNQSDDSEDVQFVGFGPAVDKIQPTQQISFDIGLVKHESEPVPKKRGRPRKITSPNEMVHSPVHSLPPGLTAKDILAASLQHQTLQQHLHHLQQPVEIMPPQEQECSPTMFPVPLFDLSEDTFMDPSSPTIFPDQVQPETIMRSARGRPIGRSRRPRGSSLLRGAERGGPRGRPRGSRGIKRLLEEMESLSYPDMDEPITLDNIDSEIGPRVSEHSGSQITEKTMALLRKSIEGKKESLEKKARRSDGSDEGSRDVDLDAKVREMKEKIEAAYQAEIKSPGKLAPEKEIKKKSMEKIELKEILKKGPPELIPITSKIERSKMSEKKAFSKVKEEECVKRKSIEEKSTPPQPAKRQYIKRKLSQEKAESSSQGEKLKRKSTEDKEEPKDTSESKLENIKRKSTEETHVAKDCNESKEPENLLEKEQTESSLQGEEVNKRDLLQGSDLEQIDVDKPVPPEEPPQSEEIKTEPEPPPKPVKPRPKSKAEIKRIKREKDRIRREAKKLAALEALKAPPPNPCEEDTRMSASDPNGDGIDDPFGSGIKKNRMEVGDPDGHKEFTVDQIAEYQWPLQGGELYMIQEQISTYLGVKSFKRKYPDLKRRPVEMEERTFLCDSGLVSESMCDLGLTAVSSSEVLDIMFQDFQDQYEELRKHMREKQARELINKQKERKKFEQSLSKSDLKEQAIQSSLSWNQAMNKARSETRRCHLDLQTWTIQYPRSRGAKMTRPTPKLGNYPVALIPGQYADYYKRYTAQELRYWPLNTVLYGPLQPNERHSTGGSEGSQSESEDSSSSDDSSDSSSEGEGTCEEEERDCKACGGGKRGGEAMVQCSQCGHNSTTATVWA